VTLCAWQWFAEVATAVPDLPLYYYHIAIMTGVNFRMDKFLEAIHGRIPTFRGLKYSGVARSRFSCARPRLSPAIMRVLYRLDADLHIYANCVAFQDGLYDVLYGKDEVRPSVSPPLRVSSCVRMLPAAIAGRVSCGLHRRRGLHVQLYGRHVHPAHGRVQARGHGSIAGGAAKVTVGC
jgi:hypothetical protein